MPTPKTACATALAVAAHTPLETPVLLCQSPSSRAEAEAAFRRHAEATRDAYPPGSAEHVSRSNTNRIITLFGQACDALCVAETDDIIPHLADLCGLKAGNDARFARSVPADAPACVRRVTECVYGFRGTVRSFTWSGQTLLTAQYAGLLNFAEGDQRASTLLTTLMRVVKFAFPTLDAPRELPSSQQIHTAASLLPAPVGESTIAMAIGRYRKLRERAIAADPTNSQYYAAIPDPRHTKGRGLLAALAMSADPADRRLAECGDLKAVMRAKAPVAYRQMEQYEENPRGYRGELHSISSVAEMWGNMSCVLGELYRQAPERLPTFEVRRLWSERVEITPSAAGIDEWNADLAGGSTVSVPLACWLVDHCAASSRALSTHTGATTGHTQALLADVGGWWTLTERFYGRARRANAPREWEDWERTYDNLRRDMRAAPVPKNERTEKATLARMNVVSLPHIWCVGLPLLGREAERFLIRYEALRHLAESTGHAEPLAVKSVGEAHKAFARAAEEYLILALPWIDTMRFAQYQHGRWGTQFVPDVDARGQIIALHCNWTGRRLDLSRAKMGVAGRRVYGPGLLNLRVLQGYLTHVRAPRLIRLGADPTEAAEANGLYPLFVSEDKSLANCAYSETTIRKARFGHALYRIATEILGHQLPPYEEFDRAHEWKGAWSLHEVRKDVATIVGAQMKDWDRACDMTMDTEDTLRKKYWERGFQPTGEIGEWRCIATYYPWVRALLDDPRRARCPLDDPAMPLPPGARAVLDTWAAEDAALVRKGRRSRHGVGDARMRHPRPDVAERNRASTSRASAWQPEFPSHEPVANGA